MRSGRIPRLENQETGGGHPPISPLLQVQGNPEYRQFSVDKWAFLAKAVRVSYSLSMKSPQCVLALAFPLALMISPIHAGPIKYDISGVASGQIGATTFTGASVELTGIGNTANVVSLFGGTIFGDPFNTFTVTIGGVGTATITDLSEIWAIPTPVGVANVPVVVIGRVDAPPALDSITGIGLVGSAALTGYGDTTGIGPITGGGTIGFPGCGGTGQETCIHTSLGLLSFSANLNFPQAPTTQATFVATLVPEPTTLLLLGSGVAALIGLSRFRLHRSGKK